MYLSLHIMFRKSNIQSLNNELQYFSSSNFILSKPAAFRFFIDQSELSTNSNITEATPIPSYAFWSCLVNIRIKPSSYKPLSTCNLHSNSDAPLSLPSYFSSHSLSSSLFLFLSSWLKSCINFILPFGHKTSVTIKKKFCNQ